MDLNTFINICYIAIPLIGTVLAFFVREQLLRISKLEEKATEFVTKDELRQVIQDKIEPIREDIAEIKTKLDKLYDFLLKQ